MKRLACLLPSFTLILSCATSRAQDMTSALVDLRAAAKAPSSDLTVLSPGVSVNNSGAVSFVGQIQTGGFFEGVFRVDQSGQANLATGFATATRDFDRTQLANNGEVLSRDRVSGSPPITFLRRWGTGVGAWSEVARGGQPGNDYTSVTSSASMNNNGFCAFVGLDPDSAFVLVSTGLLFDSTLVFASSPGIPMISDARTCVVRMGSSATDSIALLDSSLNFVRVVASASRFSALGRSPAISDDGNVIAFYGHLTQAGAAQLNTIHGSYQYAISGLPNQTLQTVPLEAGPGVFIELMTSNGPVIQRLAGIGDGGTNGFTSFPLDSRLGVTSIQENSRSCAVVFAASTASGFGVYTTRMFIPITADELVDQPFDSQKPLVFGGQTWGSTSAAVLQTGDSVNDLGTVSTVDVWDPISDRGHIALYASTASSQAACINGPRSWLRKYKQGDPNWNQDDSYGGLLYLPNGTSNPNDNMRNSGCVVACLAMLAGQFGDDCTPLQMRDWLNSNGLMNDKAQAVYSAIRFSNSDVPIERRTYMVYSGYGLNWGDLVSELRRGRPVVLGVPSRSSQPSTINSRIHRIVAYGINPELDSSDPVSPADVFVADPGRKVPTLASDPSETYVNRTLEDFFADLNAHFSSQSNRGGLQVDPFDWIDRGEFVDSTGTHTLDTRRMKQRIERFWHLTRLQSSRPIVHVESPVEVVFIEKTSGNRFATDPTLLGPSDTLLDTIGSADVAPWDDSVDDEPVEVFPDYQVLLPETLVGKSLDVEIHGVGDGQYRLSYYTGDENSTPPAPITGSITNGQIVTASFSFNPPICSGDVNGDGFVNGADLSVLLSQFGQAVARGSGADFNADGFVNGADLSVLLFRFGAGC